MDRAVRVVGAVVALGGLVLMIWALNSSYVVSVPRIEAAPYWAPGGAESDLVANNSLMFLALKNLLTGGFLFVAGTIAALIGWRRSGV